MANNVRKCEKVCRCVAMAFLAFLLLGTGTSFAATSMDSVSAFFMQNEASGDLASFWLSFLFSGDTSLPERGGDVLTSLSIALRQALRVYGLSMFVIGGFFLLAQLVLMIAETAQTGVIMGRRTNQLWAPIRLLVGISLLIPFTSGLTMGQHFVVRIAANGSELASEAWQGIVENIGDAVFTPLAPQLPDVGRVVATATEMELCRSLYQLAYAQEAADPIVTAGGRMADFRKEPAGRLNDETWIYSNAFFPSAPLCGSFAFVSSVDADKVEASQDEAYTATVSDAAKALAERLSYQTQALAGTLAASFLSAGTTRSAPSDIKVSLSDIVREQTQLIEAKQAQILAQWKQRQTTASLRSQITQGWLMAGGLPFSLARQQTALGDMAAQALPKVRGPLLGHDVLTRQAWEDAARDRLQMMTASSATFDAYNDMFHRLRDGMKQARAWLYDGQVGHVYAVLPDQQELKDRMGPYTDSAQAQETLARLVTTGAVSFGVFARSPQEATLAAHQSGPSSALLERAFIAQPLQTLAEMGRRYMGYGSWVLGMLSPALSEPATIGAALGFFVMAFLFWIAGACLLFAVPFIPLFRFVVAALGWALAVLGAVLSLPLVALAHLYPVGDGFVGPVARQAYWMWLSLFLRPVLILLGFVGGLIVFFLGVMLLNALMLGWGASIVSPHSQAFWMLRTGLALAYALGIFVLAHVSFRGISLFPTLLHDWINTRGPLPETVNVAHASTTPSSGDAAQPLSLLSVMDQGRATTAEALSNLAQSVRGLRDHKGLAAPTQEIARRQSQAAHFPHVPEMKAAERVQAQAEARAFAKAEATDPKGGRSESLAAAGAKMSSSGEHDTKAMAIARHMVPDGDADMAAPRLPTTKAFSPDEHKLTRAMKKAADKDDTQKKESAEQEAKGLDPANNPFKKP